jgi:hypothetical protein
VEERGRKGLILDRREVDVLVAMAADEACAGAVWTWLEEKKMASDANSIVKDLRSF